MQYVLRAVGRPHGEQAVIVVLEAAAATHGNEPGVTDLGQDHVSLVDSIASAGAVMRPQGSTSQGSAMDIKDTFVAANSTLTDLVLRVRPEHLALEAPPYARFHDGQTLRNSLQHHGLREPVRPEGACG